MGGATSLGCCAVKGKVCICGSKVNVRVSGALVCEREITSPSACAGRLLQGGYRAQGGL